MEDFDRERLEALAIKSGAMRLGKTDFILNIDQLDMFAAYVEYDNMKQVLEYEDIIRRAIPHCPEIALVEAGTAILHGRPTEGTRKDRLREVANLLKPYLPGAIPPLPY